MKTIHEKNALNGNAHVYLAKYMDVYNLSHYHANHELIYSHTGHTTVTIDGNTYDLSEGEAIFAYSESIHSIRSTPNSKVWVLKADYNHYKNLLWNKKLLSPLIENTDYIRPILDEIYKELNSGDKYSNDVIDGYAYILFALILRNEKTVNCSSPSRHKLMAGETYNKISQKILDEYATVTFDEMAEFAHYSKPYFSKFFHSYFGMSFVEYLNTIKVAAAVEMLKEKKFSVTEIAEKCGFNTIRNFNRVFKLITGYSPSQLPDNYVFIYNLDPSSGLDPTLSCTEITE